MAAFRRGGRGFGGHLPVCADAGLAAARMCLLPSHRPTLAPACAPPLPPPLLLPAARLPGCARQARHEDAARLCVRNGHGQPWAGVLSTGEHYLPPLLVTPTAAALPRRCQWAFCRCPQCFVCGVHLLPQSCCELHLTWQPTTLAALPQATHAAVEYHITDGKSAEEKAAELADLPGGLRGRGGECVGGRGGTRCVCYACGPAALQLCGGTTTQLQHLHRCCRGGGGRRPVNALQGWAGRRTPRNCACLPSPYPLWSPRSPPPPPFQTCSCRIRRACLPRQRQLAPQRQPLPGAVAPPQRGVRGGLECDEGPAGGQGLPHRQVCGGWGWAGSTGPAARALAAPRGSEAFRATTPTPSGGSLPPTKTKLTDWPPPLPPNPLQWRAHRPPRPGGPRDQGLEHGAGGAGATR